MEYGGEVYFIDYGYGYLDGDVVVVVVFVLCEGLQECGGYAV